MNNVVIYPNEVGGIVVMYGAPQCGLTLEEIAKKDVPVGKPFRIVSANEIPGETFFEAFEADFSSPDGYGLGYEAWLAQHGA
jgi:hypothetical protein